MMVLPFTTQIKNAGAAIEANSPIEGEVIFCVQGVVSPCLSNVYLHYVLDEWFERDVSPRLKGRAILVRYADDLVMAFENFLDAKRVLAVLGKRLARYGLTLHPDKTRLIDFRFTR